MSTLMYDRKTGESKEIDPEKDLPEEDQQRAEAAKSLAERALQADLPPDVVKGLVMMATGIELILAFSEEEAIQKQKEWALAPRGDAMVVQVSYRPHNLQ